MLQRARSVEAMNRLKESQWPWLVNTGARSWNARTVPVGRRFAKWAVLWNVWLIAFCIRVCLSISGIDLSCSRVSVCSFSCWCSTSLARELIAISSSGRNDARCRRCQLLAKSNEVFLMSFVCLYANRRRIWEWGSSLWFLASKGNQVDKITKRSNKESGFCVCYNILNVFKMRNICFCSLMATDLLVWLVD